MHLFYLVYIFYFYDDCFCSFNYLSCLFILYMYSLLLSIYLLLYLDPFYFIVFIYSYSINLYSVYMYFQDLAESPFFFFSFPFLHSPNEIKATKTCFISPWTYFREDGKKTRGWRMEV